MTGRKIITSLYAYKYSLFVAYLDGGIDIIPIPEFRKKFNITRTKVPFANKIEENKNLIIGMQALQNILFAATSNQLFSHELIPSIYSNKDFEGFYKDISGCQKIIINYSNNILYVITNERGIVAIDIKNVHQPKFKNDLASSALEGIEDGAITGVDVMENSLLISIRNRGVYRIFINEENRFPVIEREITKIRLEDVQDVVHVPKTKLIYVLDGEKGFLIMNITNNSVEFESKLPESDYPKSVFIYNQYALIRGAKGLYLFSPKSKTIERIFEKKIGAMDSYYNHFFYTQEGQIKVLILSSTGESESLEMFDRSKFTQIDVKKI